MNRDEIIQFIRDHEHCFLATIEGDQPRVRGVHLYIDDGGDMFVHTGKFKDLYSQMAPSGKVELCFVDFNDVRQVRVSALAEEYDNLEMKEKIISEREYLQAFVEQGSLGSINEMGLFRFKKPEAVFWTLATNFSPKEVIPLY